MEATARQKKEDVTAIVLARWEHASRKVKQPGGDSGRKVQLAAQAGRAHLR